MSKTIVNTQELQRFIAYWGLSYGTALSLRANVIYQTQMRILHATEQEVSISFGPGNEWKLKLHDTRKMIDPDLFPMFFEPKWETFEFGGKGFLKINGHYRTNPKIGDFTVTVTPVLDAPLNNRHIHANP